jgi:hypothetical protein
MDRKKLAGVVLLAVGCSAAARSETPKRERGPVRPQHFAPGAAWHGSQFLQADKKGRLFLLRGGTLEVFPLGGEAKLGEGRSLTPGASRAAGSEDNVVGAAMSGNGDWLVQDGADLRVFRGTKEEPIAKPAWFVSAVALVDDDPVIAGSPLTVDQARAGFAAPPADAGFLSRWESGGWKPLASAAAGKGKHLDLTAVAEQRMARLAPSSEGHLWVGLDYQHRFREYSPTGRMLTEIVVGKGDAQRGANADVREKLAKEEAKQLSHGKVRAQIFELTAEQVTEAVAEGRDGRVYFLVLGSDQGETEVSLERFDPASGNLERLPLSMPEPGRGTMAAGKDGLYVAAFKAAKGIWRLTWEQLEHAPWAPVEALVSSEGANGGPGKGQAQAVAASKRVKRAPAASPRSSQPRGAPKTG